MSDQNVDNKDSETSANADADAVTDAATDADAVTDESTTQSKQEHIKERLKDLGVSEESERPKKSWIGKYGTYMAVTVVVTLSAIYWLESGNQDNDSVQQVAAEETSSNQVQNLNPHVPNVQPNNMMTSNNQQMSWQQQNAMHQRNMQQKAWEQQKMRQQAWRKQVREQQEKNRQAWQQYIKQQQAMNQGGMPANGGSQRNMQQQNNNPNYAGSYPHPYGNNSNQRNYSQGPGYMPNYNQAPSNYPVPAPAYRQPYPNQSYYQRW